MYKKPNLKKLQAECDKFNAAHQIGADVFVKLDGVDEPFKTKTRSDAQVLSGHSAVIWLENVSGCYLLDRVTPAPNVKVTGSAPTDLQEGDKVNDLELPGMWSNSDFMGGETDA